MDIGYVVCKANTDKHSTPKLLTNNNLEELWHLYLILYVVDTVLTITVKIYLIRVLYLFIVEKRWPKWRITS